MEYLWNGVMTLLILTLLIAYVYAFVSGFSDASNAVATGIGARVMTPRQALALAAIFELIGALSGSAVARTIIEGIANVSELSYPLILGALIATISWSLITYLFGLPVSETHGLVGGVVGSAIATAGIASVLWSSVTVVIVAIVVSPALGVVFGYLLTKTINIIAYRIPNSFGAVFFSKLQISTAALVSFSHGLNDAQKPMGVATMAIIVAGGNGFIEVPMWITISMAVVITLGVYSGGIRIIKTLGLKLTRVTPYYGSLSQITASAVLNSASVFGIPISTTQTITSSIIGVSLADKGSRINWSLLGEIALSWILTLPVTILLGFIVSYGIMNVI